MHKKIYELVVEQQDISWRSIIFDLVRTEQLNPWDVDIKQLTQLYIKRLKTLKSMDLKVSGKVVLAAALLLRIKSTKFLNEEVEEFDRLVSGEKEMSEEEFYEELRQQRISPESVGPVELPQRTPQPRTRKVSVYELVKALDKALDVKQRMLMNRLHTNPVLMPRKKFDIGAATYNLFQKILTLVHQTKERLFFSKLTPTKTREELLQTFIPLVFLANQQKIVLEQNEPFGDIEITVKNTAQ